MQCQHRNVLAKGTKASWACASFEEATLSATSWWRAWPMDTPSASQDAVSLSCDMTMLRLCLLSCSTRSSCSEEREVGWYSFLPECNYCCQVFSFSDLWQPMAYSRLMSMAVLPYFVGSPSIVFSSTWTTTCLDQFETLDIVNLFTQVWAIALEHLAMKKTNRRFVFISKLHSQCVTRSFSEALEISTIMFEKSAIQNFNVVAWRFRVEKKTTNCQDVSMNVR